MLFASDDSYKNPIEGTTYISPQIKNTYGDKGTVRLITRAIEQSESYTFAKIKNEIVLRETPGGKNIIKARVLEDPRGIIVLSIQEYTPATGVPHKASFAFIGEEIPKLFQFMKDVITMQFGSKRYQRLSDDDIEHIEITDSQALQIFQHNQEVFANIMRSGITTEDIIAVGYRKMQLDFFKKLLNDHSFFDDLKARESCSNEGLWQRFFEKNQWIFGYGLGYVFLTGLDDKKLEQVVQGYDVNTHGKRIDALMKTRGIISNLCFVEIKTHTTKLLENDAYRVGCFAPSKELAGAVAQVQGSVALAVKNFTERIDVVDSLGNPTGEEIYNYQPKSFLVIGSLNEFDTNQGINMEKLRSFELYRRNTIYPEIITFDELFERARFITKNNELQ
jgi:hypothetical protein